MTPGYTKVQNWMSMPSVAALMRRTLKIACAIFVLAVAYLLFSWYSTSQAAAEARTLLMQHQADLQESKNAIAQASAKEKQETEGSAAVSRLQSAFEASALLANAELLEFEASSQFTPFLTRFAKAAQQTDWLEVPVKTKLRGAPSAVLAVLHQLAQEDIPFEFDSLEMTRVGFAGSGNAIVEVSVGLRVLTRLGGT